MSFKSVSTGLSANQMNHNSGTSIKKKKLMRSQHHSSPLYLLSFPLSAGSLSFCVICLLACSYSLINSLIKDTTSKPQLQGPCLPAFVQDGNWGKEPARTLLSPSSSNLLSTLGRARPSVSLAVVVLVSEQSQQLFNAQGELWCYPAWILITPMLSSKISLTRLCPGYFAQGWHGVNQRDHTKHVSQSVFGSRIRGQIGTWEGWRKVQYGANEISRVEHLQSPANEAYFRRYCMRMEGGHFSCKSMVLQLLGIRWSWPVVLEPFLRSFSGRDC